jgi:hypothetical protein
LILFIIFSELQQQEILRELISMKTIVRAFVVVLALTGVAATTQTTAASTQNKVTAARVSVLPVPTCPPDDPNACGMGLGR